VILNIDGQVSLTRYGIAVGTTSNSVDYVILDGSNSDGGTTRDWTIKSMAALGIEPIDIYGDYCTIKNCIVDMNSAGYSGSGYGITFRDVSPTATYGTILNCKITGNNAISIGRGTAGDVTGCLVKNNEAHFVNRGVYVSRASTVTIEDNELIGDAYNSYPSSTLYGIYCASPASNTGELIIQRNIIRDLGFNGATASAVSIRVIAAAGPGTYRIRFNKIYNIENSTSSVTAHTTIGISVSGTGATNIIDIHNNFISGFLDNDAVSRAGTSGTRGIWLSSAAVYTIYYNSIYIADTDRDYKLTTCLYVGIAGANVTSRNNIFFNANSSSNANSYAIYHGVTPTTCSSNYNNVYVNGATNAFVGFEVSDQQTLANWIANTPYDDNSKSVSVTFTSATDLHLSGGSIGDVNLIGTPIVGYTTDIDGNLRSGTSPYMGSDENTDSPLPVELTALNYRFNHGFVDISWSTATEVNSNRFEIERKSVSSDWTKIGEVAASGNSNSPKEYMFTDNSVTSGQIVYRLKIVDNDGSFAYSKEIEVENLQPSTYQLSQNFPNPFNPTTTISYQILAESNVKLLLFSITGELVRELVNSSQAAGSYNVTLDASGLASGTYIYRLVAGDFVSTKKLVILK